MTLDGERGKGVRGAVGCEGDEMTRGGGQEGIRAWASNFCVLNVNYQFRTAGSK